MKKSVSSPSLSTMTGKMQPTVPVKLRKSVSTQAFPIDSVLSSIDALSSELQMESMLHVTGAQAAACSIPVNKFPYEILQSGEFNNTVKDLVNCLIEPSEKEDMPRMRIPRCHNSFLDVCEADFTSEKAQKYFSMLRSIRKRRNRNSFSDINKQDG